MRAIIEVEITGDEMNDLTDDVIRDILDAVIKDGADSVCMTGKYRIIEITERNDE